MTRQTATAIKKAIKATGAACTMDRIGTGKHVEIGLYGADAEAIAKQLEGKGYCRTPGAGRGTSYMDYLSMDARRPARPGA